NVYPSQSELLGSRDLSVRKNIIHGKFKNVEEYLEIQFRLLREDFVAPLRESIAQYRKNNKAENIDVFKNVRIFTITSRLGYHVTKMKLNNKLENLENSKKFMNGSLLIFTKNNFSTMYLAKVAHREDADFENNEIIIEFVEEQVSGSNWTMVECNNFFEPYFQVLEALQAISAKNFPMEKYLIQVNTSKTPPPKYLKLRNFSIAHSNLNEAQNRALKASLSEEFVVIQGPPGTGKTFLGLKIAETLIRNHNIWYKETPMLVISHKNHALDQFLEGLIPITKRIVRVGGQSKSEKLKRFNLTELQNEEELSSGICKLGLRNYLIRHRRDDLEIMQEALVVGMTTTNAARMRTTLERLRCPIVIVEEAAEILEAHVVASLNQHTQHLILLGDHQQLKPATADRKIGQNYCLGVSLFERMVINGIQCYQLEVQHRMRPEVSSILKSTTYPFLKDHPSVHNKPSVMGVTKNVLFINHNHPEQTSKFTSKLNKHEAKFLIYFARHLILNGYGSDDVAILTTYSGQVDQMKREVRNLADRELLKDVRISTLDAFQGREAEIILLSLVRSDGIGFLSAENRICVALSRAKNGYYLMGNMNLLSQKSTLWNTIKKRLEEQQAIGRDLPLRCQLHPEMTTQAKCADDFLQVDCGGCSKICQMELPCGHRCRYSCHIIDRKHY
ncbi:NFX1-type zinc finger-containing protein 1-like, partial [Asbolus verrucosus]